jgi:hypothetical protein
MLVAARLKDIGMARMTVEYTSHKAQHRTCCSCYAERSHIGEYCFAAAWNLSSSVLLAE